MTRDDEEKKRIWFESLQKEVQRLEEEITSVYTVYFGGGTPSLIDPSWIKALLQALPNTPEEVTLEWNPEDVTLEKLEAFLEAGVTRCSLGVQSFHANELKQLTRKTSPDDLFTLLTKAGCTNVSIDLMYDTPLQTLSSWKETLEKVLTLPVHHVSLYNLTIEPNTLFFRKAKQITPLLPTQTDSKEMYLLAQEMLSQGGWKHYELSAFAKEGKVSKHNLCYWTNRPFIGLGPSAFSHLRGVRSQNVCDLASYAERLSAGKSPCHFQEKLEEKAAERERLVLGLRVLEGVDSSLFSLEEETQVQIEQLISEGFLERVSSRLRLTKRGILFFDSVAEVLI